MTRRKIAFTALILAGCIGFVLLRSGPEEPDSALVVFTGQETNHGQLVARFRLMNAGPGPLLLETVRVQILSNQTWQTWSIAPLQKSLSARVQRFHFVDVQTSLDFMVQPPPTPPWRVSVRLARAQSGLSALAAKARNAWQRRTLAAWLDRSRSFGDFREVASEQVSR